MRFFKNYILTFIFVIALQQTSFSQIKFWVGPAIGVSIPSGDYAGTTQDFYNGTGYGLNSGLTIGAILKAKFTALNLKVSVNYTSLSTSGNALPSSGSISEKQNLFMIGIGPEFAFGPAVSQIKPYLGVNLLFTSFGGETTFQDVPRVPDGTYSTAATTRTGIGVDIGTEIGFAGKYALDINFQYSFLNLLGKSFNGGDSRIFSYTSLNDAQDPLFAENINTHPIGSSRTISMFQLNLAFLFGF